MHIPKIVIFRFLAVCAFLSSTLALTHIGFSTVQAATVKGDPLVIAVNDATNTYGPCTETFRANIGTSYVSSITTACPANTIGQYRTVSLSYAIKHKMPFFAYSSSHASDGNFQKTLSQHTLLQHTIPAVAHPVTRCGQEGSASETWSPGYGDQYYSTITFYKSSDCSTVSFDAASINLVSHKAPYDYLWDYDLYAGYQYSVGCPDISVENRFHLVSSSAPVGYYYENWISEDHCNWPAYTTSYNNIGPIN